jgi:hypothetical protein
LDRSLAGAYRWSSIDRCREGEEAEKGGRLHDGAMRCDECW